MTANVIGSRKLRGVTANTLSVDLFRPNSRYSLVNF